MRAANDFYPTPAWCIDAILPHLPRAGGWLDPACGDGAILMALERTGREAHGIELDSARAAACVDARLSVRQGDAFREDWDRPDGVLMNPPYRQALEFVEQALAQVQRGGTVAALLRLGFLASQKRATFHRINPSDVYVLPQRPSFTGNGKTDSSDLGWFVWGPGRGGKWSVLDVKSERPEMRSGRSEQQGGM